MESSEYCFRWRGENYPTVGDVIDFLRDAPLREASDFIYEYAERHTLSADIIWNAARTDEPLPQSDPL